MSLPFSWATLGMRAGALQTRLNRTGLHAFPVPFGWGFLFPEAHRGIADDEQCSVEPQVFLRLR